MLLPVIVAGTLMVTAWAVMSIDTPIGKSALYALYQWQRRRRARRRRGATTGADRPPGVKD
jgi:hypothetical protein